MREVFNRFITFDALNDHPMIHAGLAIIWVLLLVAAFLSIRSQTFGAVAKWIWFLVILALPILGLAIYAVWCLVRADWSFLKFIFGSPNATKSMSPRK